LLDLQCLLSQKQTLSGGFEVFVWALLLSSPITKFCCSKYQKSLGGTLKRERNCVFVATMLWLDGAG